MEGMLHTRYLESWQFKRLKEDTEWEEVHLPHNPFVVTIHGHPHWQGRCVYRRSIQAMPGEPGCRHTIHFGAAMHSAIVRVNGEIVMKHRGGYLPFEIDITRYFVGQSEALLDVEIDNCDNPDVPPGKALDELDFCWYGGLYREVQQRCYPPVHITDSTMDIAQRGGGILFRTVAVEAELALAKVEVHIRNTNTSTFQGRLEVRLYPVSRDNHGLSTNLESEPVLVHEAGQVRLEPDGADWYALSMQVDNPDLWSPSEPNLYSLRVLVLDGNGRIIDQRWVQVGIRQITLNRTDGLTINGKRIRPRGVNRHQDHPYVGYALPRAAQYRDALRIKAGGFDYVRLSHYPQSPHFLDACDKLGILVMNCLPGWQHMGGDAFRKACENDARGLIRRDRNHPSVILWELSLNETEMDQAFMDSMNQIAREEYPGDQMLTCGWSDNYDVYLRSRQHGNIHTWKNGDKALVIAEYGDWEYYADTAGFDQKSGRGLLDQSKNSRVCIGDSESRLLQQVANHSEALEENLISPAAFCGLWSAFDYPRGYEKQYAACGIMSPFRRAKYSWHYYRSQRHWLEAGTGWGGPMVFIASKWDTASSPLIRVFSNLPDVELRLNGALLKPASKRASLDSKAAQPFLFSAEHFTPGVLEAVATDGSGTYTRHSVRTPGKPWQLQAEVDTLGIKPAPSEEDIVILNIGIVDRDGQVCHSVQAIIRVEVLGENCLMGCQSGVVESGTASFIVRIAGGSSSLEFNASIEEDFDNFDGSAFSSNFKLNL